MNNKLMINNYLNIINLLQYNVLYHNNKINTKNIKMIYKTFFKTQNNNNKIKYNF